MSEKPLQESSSFYAEINSPLEPLIRKYISEPALALVPRSVHPNTISLVAHGLCWLATLLAIRAPHMSPLGSMVALVFAGLSIVVAAIADCLDGMQARRTNRCSKLGEMMDHWLDAINLPLVLMGITFALDMEPWAFIAVNVTGVMVYNSQLVIYHHSGRFVHPSTSGTAGQMAVGLVYMAIGLLFFFVPRDTPAIHLVAATLACITALMQMRVNIFYYRLMRRHIVRHLMFVAAMGAFSAAYLLGIVDTLAFLLLVTFGSFRISGTYVLFTIVKRRFSGWDAGLVLWIAAMFSVHYTLDPVSIGGSYTLQGTLPYLCCLYLAARNMIDFFRHLPELRPDQEQRLPGRVI